MYEWRKSIAVESLTAVRKDPFFDCDLAYGCMRIFKKCSRDPASDHCGGCKVGSWPSVASIEGVCHLRLHNGLNHLWSLCERAYRRLHHLWCGDCLDALWRSLGAELPCTICLHHLWCCKCLDDLWCSLCSDLRSSICLHHLLWSNCLDDLWRSLSSDLWCRVCLLHLWCSNCIGLLWCIGRLIVHYLGRCHHDSGSCHRCGSE